MALGALGRSRSRHRTAALAVTVRLCAQRRWSPLELAAGPVLGTRTDVSTLPPCWCSTTTGVVPCGPLKCCQLLLAWCLLACVRAPRRHAGSVLVHCMAGVSRSATVVIGYMMWKERVGYDEAFRWVGHGRQVGGGREHGNGA